MWSAQFVGDNLQVASAFLCKKQNQTALHFARQTTDKFQLHQSMLSAQMQSEMKQLHFSPFVQLVVVLSYAKAGHAKIDWQHHCC